MQQSPRKRAKANSPVEGSEGNSELPQSPGKAKGLGSNILKVPKGNAIVHVDDKERSAPGGQALVLPSPPSAENLVPNSILHSGGQNRHGKLLIPDFDSEEEDHHKGKICKAADGKRVVPNSWARRVMNVEQESKEKKVEMKCGEVKAAKDRQPCSESVESEWAQQREGVPECVLAFDEGEGFEPAVLAVGCKCVAIDTRDKIPYKSKILKVADSEHKDMVSVCCLPRRSRACRYCGC